MTEPRARGRATMFDLWGPDRHRDVPRLPHLVAESVRLAREAGPRELAVMVAMQVATIAGVVASALVARSLLAGLLDAEQAGGEVGDLIPEVLTLALLSAGLGISHAVQLHQQRILGELCTSLGEQRVLAAAGAVELAAFDEPDYHDAVERAVLAARRLPGVVAGLSGLLRSLAGALGAVVALAVVVPVFAPIVVLVLLPLGLAARRAGRAFYGFAYNITPQDRERRYLGDVLVDRDAAKEVRAFDLTGFLTDRHGRLWERRVRELRDVAARQLTFSALANLVASAIVSAALLALIALALADHVSLAAAGTAAATIALLGQRLAAAATSAGMLTEAALFIDDYLALVGAGPPPSVDGTRPPEAPDAIDVRAEGVTFAYAGARDPALRDVSLEIGPGEVVALVGENGSGKTTLAKLLAGLYVPDEGRVTLNGADTAEAAPAALRAGVAVIFQDFMRYALTARENIGLGRAASLDDEDRVHRAARTAGAHEDLERLPEGYDTMLGPAFEGGTDLSIGQWQRVALARAIFRGAPFVILDEPTASLDARAESDLFARIRKVLAGRSVLLISHRFSTVRTADRIHVMSGGEIVETGTHDELMAAGGIYAELFRLQAAPYR